MLNFKFSLLTISWPKAIAFFSIQYKLFRPPWSLFSFYYSSTIFKRDLQICICGKYFVKKWDKNE